VTQCCVAEVTVSTLSVASSVSALRVMNLCLTAAAVEVSVCLLLMMMMMMMMVCIDVLHVCISSARLNSLLTYPCYLLTYTSNAVTVIQALARPLPPRGEAGRGPCHYPANLRVPATDLLAP